MAQHGTTEQRSLAHWAEERRAGMEAFYALAVEDYRQMVAARDWAADLRDHSHDGRLRVLDVACGSGKFPAELLRQGLAGAVGDLRIEIDLLDPSPFSIGEARAVLRPPLVAGATHELRVQDLPGHVGGFDAVWATHALYAVPTDEIGTAAARMHACLRPGGFGAVVHATTASHYLRFADAFRATFAPDAEPFTTAEQVTDALCAAGAAPRATTIRYEVGHDDRAVVEGFLQRCAFDDSVPLERMEREGAVGEYLAGCSTDGRYRFAQEVDVITWRAAA